MWLKILFVTDVLLLCGSNIIEYFPRIPDKNVRFGGIMDHIQNQLFQFQKNTGRISASNGDIGLSSMRSIHDLLRDMFLGTSNIDVQSVVPEFSPLGIFSRAQFPFTGSFPQLLLAPPPRDWWNGPNVCSDRREDDLPTNTANASVMDPTFGSPIHIRSNDCSYSQDRELYTCITTVQKPNLRKRYTVKYYCCHGYGRHRNGFGCTKEIVLTTLPETLISLGLSSFHQAMLDSGLLENLVTGNFTLFAPINEALQEFQAPINEVEASVSSRDPVKILLGHVVNGLIRRHDLSDEMVLNSSAKLPLRINHRSTFGRINTTVNCANIISTVNNYAENGVVYVIDRMIQPVTKTLETTLVEDGRFNAFIQLMKDADLSYLLSDPDGHVTVLAPTDTAFLKIYPDLNRELRSDISTLQRLLKAHILRHVWCTTFIDDNVIAESLSGIIRFSQPDFLGLLKIENQTVLEVDKLATNGIIHVIDGVIIPQEFRSLLTVAADAGLGSFVELVKSAGMELELDTMRNVTVFAPTNQAIKSLSNGNLTTEELRHFVLRHIVQQPMSKNDFKDDSEITSAVESYKLHISVRNFTNRHNMKSTVYTVNCARIAVPGIKNRNGYMYVIEKVLMPPSMDIVQTLTTRGDFTKFLAATAFPAEILLNSSNLAQTYTVFAPPDSLFTEGSPALEMTKVATGEFVDMNGEPQLRLVSRPICCSEMARGGYYPYVYRDRKLLNYSPHRSLPGDENLVSVITECDILATNGVIHILGQPKYEPELYPPLA